MIKPFLICIPILILSGCGSDSDSDLTVYLDNYYQEQSGDIIRYQNQLQAEYSTGQTLDQTELEENIYSTVETIPAKYNYNGDLAGPYLLNSEYDDSVLDGYNYQTLSGQTIIDDGLDYFDSIEFNTIQGTDTPDNVQIGDQFTYTTQQILFDSQTTVEAGYTTMSMEIDILGSEQINVIAGNFDTIKISHSTELYSERNLTIDSQSDGHIWIDKANGHLVKMTIEGTADYIRSNGSEFSVTINSTNELHSMELSGAEEASNQQRSITANPIASMITAKSIAAQITKNLPSKLYNAP